MKKRIYFLFIIIKYLFIPLSAQTHVISHSSFQIERKSDDICHSVTGIYPKTRAVTFTMNEMIPQGVR
jgi:hypothetical protein